MMVTTSSAGGHTRRRLGEDDCNLDASAGGLFRLLGGNVEDFGERMDKVTPEKAGQG